MKQGMSGEEALAKLNLTASKSSSNQDDDENYTDDDDDDSFSDDGDEEDEKWFTSPSEGDLVQRVYPWQFVFVFLAEEKIIKERIEILDEHRPEGMNQ